MDDRLLSFMMSERGLNNAEIGRAHNKSRNIAVVATSKNTGQKEYLTSGEYESSDYYNFGGGYTLLENRYVVWLTDFIDIQENVSRLKPVKLAENVILLLMEIHTFDGYNYSAYMMINKELQVLVPLTRMRQDVIFGRSHELRVENGTAYGYSSAHGRLQRFTISLNGDPTIDTDNDGYGDYYEQLLGTDANDPHSPLLGGDIDTDSDGIPDHMDYDDDADGISDMDDSAPLDRNSDYDGDGLSDGYETDNGLNPMDAGDGNIDSDGDGIRDADEMRLGLNPTDPNDGKDADTDLDGFTNGQEILVGTDPLDSNSYDGDGDGVLGINDSDDTDPMTDNDGDGIADSIEKQAGFDPNDPLDIDFSIDENNDGIADIWASLQAGLPVQGAMSVEAWSQYQAQMSTPANLIVTDFINQPRQRDVDLSALSGEVSYEFVVHLPVDRSGKVVLIGERNNSIGLNTNWSLSFEQGGGSSSLGLTKFGTADYTFSAVAGQSVASPYGDPVHLVYLSRNGTNEVWVNGVQVGQHTGNALLINHAQTPLGINEGNVESGEGIYGFAAHNRALSGEEIAAAYRKALSIYVDTDGDGIYDVIDPDDDNDGYLDNGTQDTSGYGTGLVVAGVLGDINDLLANNQNIEESVLIDSGRFINITSTNMTEYNVEFARVGNFSSVNEIQAIIDNVNETVVALNAIVGFANANDASNLSFADLSNVMHLTSLDANNLAYYQTLIAAEVGTNVDSASKLQTLVDSANASQTQIDAISQYAANNNADALTIDMLQSIAGLTVDSNNLTYYKEFVVDSVATAITDLVSLQILINDADVYALDPQWLLQDKPLPIILVVGQCVCLKLNQA
ncbi:internalin putative [Vibrio ponticus]|nr:internalin putative [Vibrio ponticus]